MKLAELSPDQIRAYFEARIDQLPNHSTGQEVNVRCPFHDDGTASMGIDLERGAWICHAGCGSGMIIDFEKMFQRTESNSEALKSIGEAASVNLFTEVAGVPKTEATYQYRDEEGKLLFEVIKKRFADGKKTFQQRHRNDESGEWVYNLNGVRRTLYRIQEVLESRDVVIVEGEKDTDRLRDELAKFREANPDVKVPAVTTSPGGAGKWNDEYATYFKGKRALIVPDNDKPGQDHALRVAASIYPYAYGVKILNLPNMPDHGSISEFLDQRDIPEFFKCVRNASMWKPAAEEQTMFVPVHKFCAMTPEHIDWTVERVIQRGSNGFFAANPKGGKSFAVGDLCLALASGGPWLGFSIPKPTKVALVSREDNPDLTSIRLRKLAAGRGLDLDKLGNHFYVNSRRQTKTLMLDDDQQLQELIDNMKRLETEICFLDVFNVLHAADENDNTEMRSVLQRVSRIQNDVGCAICLIHHWSKGNPEETITQKLRGASAIAGWAEWVCGIRLVNKEHKLRGMEFDIKVAESPEPVLYKIENQDELGHTYLRLRPDLEHLVAQEQDNKQEFRYR